MNARVRAAMKKVEELKLDPTEMRALGQEITSRSECRVDLTAANDEGERALLLTVKNRIDAHLRGETKPVSMAEVDRKVRAKLREARVIRRARVTG